MIGEAVAALGKTMVLHKCNASSVQPSTVQLLPARISLNVSIRRWPCTTCALQANDGTATTERFSGDTFGTPCVLRQRCQGAEHLECIVKTIQIQMPISKTLLRLCTSYMRLPDYDLLSAAC